MTQNLAPDSICSSTYSTEGFFSYKLSTGTSMVIAEPLQNKTLVAGTGSIYILKPSAILENVNIAMSQQTNNINIFSKSWVEITSLSEELPLSFPLMVSISFEDNVFVADCPTFNLFTFGDTYEEALDSLKGLMADCYKIYLSDYPDKLTPCAVDLLRIYMAFLGKSLPN